MFVLCFKNNRIRAKKWSVKYIKSTCWLKFLFILRMEFCCYLFNVVVDPFVFGPALW